MLELCVGGIDDVLLAQKNNVPRIELNSAIALGGLTPSLALLLQARKAYSGKIIAMVRPREGDFCYSHAEIQTMLLDAELLVQHGADGIAIGFLTASGSVDAHTCLLLRKRLPNTHLVFHRAFDVAACLTTALSQIIELGFQTILTSGGCQTALAGAPVLQSLNQQAAGKIQILPAGGIRATNVASVLQLTGCPEIHAAVREIIEPPPAPHHRSLHFGIPGQSSLSSSRTSAAALQQLLHAIRSAPPPNTNHSP